MAAEELKVTKICEMCGGQYGLWRVRCPACGTANKHHEAATSAPRPTLSRKVQTRTSDECIFCQTRIRRKQRGKKCPHCDEPIHPNCLALHEAPCEAFQVERLAAIKRLEEQPHGR